MHIYRSFCFNLGTVVRCIKRFNITQYCICTSPSTKDKRWSVEELTKKSINSPHRQFFQVVETDYEIPKGCAIYAWKYSVKLQCTDKHVCIHIARHFRINFDLTNICLIYSDLNVVVTVPYKCCTWWRHQMETFSALLALCEGNPPVTGGFP